MEELLSILLGIGLSAACGFRVFVPLLVMSIAARTGHLHLAAGFDWIGSWPALLSFTVATCVEIAAYYIPWLDHLLDLIATPAAIAAGTLAMASSIGDLSPLLRWSLAIIAGGGAAGLMQALTSLTRLASTATTGGLGNPLVATAEAGGSILLSALAVMIPFAAALLAVSLLVLAANRIRRRRHKQVGA